MEERMFGETHVYNLFFDCVKIVLLMKLLVSTCSFKFKY